ncbi:MAG TPA: bifunctional phosphopantothenoylcysteine decarboxylase/phosphopantothenate--cysteine ligase CoaBC [Pelotomaculum sp.]|nr:bifunctional phosphopantothenoylcysteine decarboxylase/phosphopantothenate--cysteine ligase CoaBC [Pelotomaculum sp.]
MLAGKTITLGVTGGIAAFKVAQLASNLKAAGAEVHVVMTRSAQEFVRPLTFQVLTDNRVYTDLFDRASSWNVQHVELATQSDLIVVVPATANIIAKAAVGLADDLLSTVITAAVCPVLFCPAMNKNMYENPIVQRNLTVLRELGYHFVEPGRGRLACGVEGIGRLAEIEAIQENIEVLLASDKDLSGMSVLVTAGPTVEPIDPVRYLTNRSSGKMGYAVAGAALRRGARVILVSGPTALKPPHGVEFIGVQTAREMFDAVLAQYPHVDVVVKSAAVADYRPKEAAQHKIKKSQDEMTIELEKNPDILAELGRRKTRQLLVGFAAETKELEKNALRKLEMKNLDLLVANDVTRPGAEFGSDTNIVKLVYPGQVVVQLPKMDKKTLADRILDEVLNLRASGQ